MFFDPQEIIFGTYLLVGFTTILYAFGGLFRGAFKTAYFAIATLVSAILVFVIIYHVSIWWFFATPETLLSFLDVQLTRFNLEIPLEVIALLEHTPSLYLAVMLVELAFKVVFYIALFGLAIYIVRFFLFRIPWWLFFNKMRYTYKTETTKRGKTHKVREKKPQKRLLGFLIGGLQGAVIGVLAFIPMTALASLFENFDAESFKGEMWTVDGFEMSTVIESSQLIRSSGVGSYAASFEIGEKTLDTYVFDLAISARNHDVRNQGRVALREELKIVMDMVPIFQTIGVFDEDFAPEALTDEQVAAIGGLFVLLGESKLLPMALPVAAEYAVQLEDVQSILEGYEPDLSVLYEIDWAGEFNRMGGIFVAAYALIDGQSFDDFDPLAFDSEQVVDLIHRLAELDVVEKLVPIIVDYALQRDDVKGWLDGLVLDLSLIAWQDEIRNLGDLYEAILNSGLDSLDDLDVGIEILKQFDYDALEVVVEILFESALIDQVLRGVISRLSLEFVPEAYQDVVEQLWEDIDVPTLDFENEFLAMVNILRVISLLDFDEDTPSRLTESVGRLRDVDINRLVDALMASTLVDQGLEPFVIRLLEEAELNHWIIVKPAMSIVWADELRAVFFTVRNVFEVPLDIDDFDQNTPAELFGRIDLDVLMRSHILTTSIAHFLVAETGVDGMLEGFVFVEYAADDPVWYDVLDGETVVEKGEVRKLFEVIFLLMDGLDESFATMRDNPTALDLGFLFDTLGRDAQAGMDDFDRILASNIIYQTLDRLIRDNLDILAEALPMADFTLHLPAGLIVQEGPNEGRIHRAEIRALVEAAQALGFDDLEGLDFSSEFLLDLDVATIEVVLDASLIYILIEAVASDFLTTQGFPITAVMMETDPLFPDLLARAELVRVFRAFSLLQLTELDGFGASFAMVTDLLGGHVDETGDDFDRLLASDILHAIVSDLLLGIDALTIPASVVEIEQNGVQLITRQELRAVIEAVKMLGLDSDAFAFDFGYLFDLEENDLDVLLASRIIHETISDIVIGLAALEIPFFAHENNDVEAPLAAVEIKRLWFAATTLSLDESLSLTLEDIGLLDSEDLDRIFASDIVYHTVADIVARAPVTIPAQALETEGIYEGMVQRTELKALIRSIALLGLTGDDFTIDLQSASTLEDAEWDILLDSVIVRQTISEPVAPIITGLLSAPPATIYEDESTGLITNQELRAFFTALSLLGIADGDSVPVDLNHITGLVGQNEDEGEDDMHRVLQSDILYAQLSDLIVKGLEGVLTIPAEALSLTPAYLGMVDREEIYDLTAALVALGLDNFATIDFDFNAFNLADDAGIDALAEQMRILNTSIILRAELDRAVDTMLTFVGIVHVSHAPPLSESEWDEEIDTLSALLKTAGGSDTLGAGLDFDVFDSVSNTVDTTKLDDIETLLKLIVDAHKINHHEEIPRMMSKGINGIFVGMPGFEIEAADMDTVTPDDPATWYIEIEALMDVIATGSTFAALQTPVAYADFNTALQASQLLQNYDPTWP